MYIIWLSYFNLEQGHPRQFFDLHIVLRRYRTSIYERLHRYLYSRYARLRLIPLFVYEACYRTPLWQACISYIALLWMLFLNINLLIRCFCQYSRFIRPNMPNGIFKNVRVFNKHKQVKRARCLLVTLISYKSTIYECVHRLILERAYAKHRVTIITIDSNVIKSSVM